MNHTKVLMNLTGLALLAAATCFAQSVTPKFVYTVASDTNALPKGEGCYGTSYVFGQTVDAVTGALTPIPGSPFPVEGGDFPLRIVADPLGRFVWVTQRLDCRSGEGRPISKIVTLAVNPISGALTQVGVPISSGGYLVGGVTTDATGQFLFAANKCLIDLFCPDSAIGVFAIHQTTGALTPIPGSPFLLNLPQLTSIALHPGGRLAFVTSASTSLLIPNSGLVATLAVNPATGALSRFAGPYPAQGEDQSSVVVDPSGNFVFALGAGFGADRFSNIGSWTNSGGPLTAP